MLSRIEPTHTLDIISRQMFEGLVHIVLALRTANYRDSCVSKSPELFCRHMPSWRGKVGRGTAARFFQCEGLFCFISVSRPESFRQAVIVQLPEAFVKDCLVPLMIHPDCALDSAVGLA